MERNHPEEWSTAEKGDIEVFKVTKNRFALRFLRFPKGHKKYAQKSKLDLDLGKRYSMEIVGF